MPSIRVLDPALVNKIAAGEVIERPASIVKELMENALDAGASRIDVTLEEGGAKLVSVSDDGCGIAADELALAVTAHATSKITSVEDLFDIHTMGFRGEALASIAAVSRVRIVSRTADQIEAAKIDAADGVVGPVEPCAAAPGTTIEVHNLFFNLPARRKYLRTQSAELGHVTEQIARVALARPDVTISQSHGGRLVRRLPGTGDRRARIADFYGPELAECLIPFARQEPDLRIEGLFAPPAASKANSRWQYVFLNGRYIRDRELTGFVFREAFRGLIEPSRYPVVFLFLTADPHSFDVNVHPTKIEVRWRDAGRVKSQVLAVLREVILSRDLTPALHAGPATPFDPAAAQANVYALADQLRAFRPGEAGDVPSPGGFASSPLSVPQPALRDGLGHPPPFALHSHTPSQTPRFEAFAGGPPPRSPAHPMNRVALTEVYRPPDEAGQAASGAAAPRTASSDGGQASRTLEPDSTEQDAPSVVPLTLPGRAIQIHNTYLVCETPEGMLIIDQHALHERILYEELRERITGGALEAQRLLLPETFDVSPTQLAALDGGAEVFRQLGLEVEPFGPRSVVVRAAPSLLGDANVREFVQDLLDRLAESDRHNSEGLIHKVLDMMACKAAVKAGDRLTPEAIEALLARRHLIDRSSNCPHGRPTTLRLTVRDLERQFKRA